MNHSLAICLINKNARAVVAIYDKDVDQYNEKKNKRTLFKTLDTSIEKDDLIVVPTGTRHNYTVVKVIEVDATIDFNSMEEVNWVVCKLDTTEHEHRLAQEKVAVDAVKRAELAQMRDNL